MRDCAGSSGRRRAPARPPTRRPAFTLVELLVIVAIVCAMAGVGVVSVRGGQAAARVKGATRDVFAAIRQARSQALVSQRPVVVTYSTEESDGEPAAKVEMTSVDLFSASADPSNVQTFTGPSIGIRLAEEKKARESRRRTARTAAASEAAAPEPAAAADESLLHEVLFAPIREEVVRGMRLKVVKGDDEPDTAERGPTFVSFFSNVDALMRKYKESKGSGDAASDGDGRAETDKEAAADAAKAERQPPVSVVWDTNGRVEAHQVWIYADGQRPEDGLSIRIDRFGAATVISGDGRGED